MPFFDDVKDFFTSKDDDYYYNRLYPLQDKILTIAFSETTNFYLSGGTTLNRFILSSSNNHIARHSDDLDFFINLDSSDESLAYFHRAKQDIVNRISTYYTVEPEINFSLVSEYKALSDTSFIYYVYSDDVKLKLQFVLDERKKSDATLLLKDGYRLDNLHNILTNKIATIRYREEFKDFVDLYNIAKFDESIDWKNIAKQTANSSKISLMDSENFKHICKEWLEFYQNSDNHDLIKRVSFGQDKSYQLEQVDEVLFGFEKLVLDKL